MNLESAFAQYIEQQFPGLRSQKVLLAVSGGPDSMALLHLFASGSAAIAVAHCNFGLRGAESDADEDFVKQVCAGLGVTCYAKRFDTTQFAAERSLGIQAAARELRYRWFEQLRSDLGFDLVATAHHRDDNVETVMMNLLRGSGLKGISGIPARNGFVVRPLLFATKNELTAYLHQHGHTYRSDASNAENKYTRNKVRNELIPQLTHINPLAAEHIDELSKHAQFAYSLIREKTDELINRYVIEQNGTVVLNYAPVSSLPFASGYLYEMLSVYGFNATQCALIHHNFMAGRPGTRFLSATFELLVDRVSLFIVPLDQHGRQSHETVIQKLSVQTVSLNGCDYVFELTEKSLITTYEKNHLYLDAGKLNFPLRCRTWKQGDTFHPLGSPGAKKISDFLIDNKVSVADKRNTCVLESDADGIVAVLDRRIDEHVKIKPDTQTVLHIYATKKETM